MSVDLTEGKIAKKLLSLAVPVMLTSLVQMAYNLMDQMWLGHVGSSALVSAGAAGYFLWLGLTAVVVAKVGSEILVAQKIGEGKREEAYLFYRTGHVMAFVIAVLFLALCWWQAESLVSIIHFDEEGQLADAAQYLRIVASGFPAFFAVQIYVGVLTSLGRTKLPFILSTCGLALNMILDPILIYGYLGFEQMGAVGAAWATMISQVFVACLFFFYLKGERNPFLGLERLKVGFDSLKKVFRLGVPVSVENSLFCLITLYIGRLTSTHGSQALAAQGVGVQIESISWMAMHGLATALIAFVGQNYGAKKWDRITEGYRLVMGFTVVQALVSTALFMFLGEDIFSLFSEEPETVSFGGKYLFIIGTSQVFMGMEIIAAGALKGVGRTTVCSVVSFVLSAVRIPLAMYLMSYDSLGVMGVWWAMTTTSIAKGVVMVLVFQFGKKR